MKPETIQKILEQTKSDYNTIASDFDQTRSYLWPGLFDFKKYVKAGDKILDLGCGNGKLRLLFKDLAVDYTGLDNSAELLKIAESRNDFKLAKQNFIQADISSLPLADNSFDIIFFIAVFHHIPGNQLRLKVLTEVKRILKPGGVLIMTNWNRYQKEFLGQLIHYTFLKIIGKSDLDFKDIWLPWMQGKVHRYYHLFTLGELKKLVIESGLEIQGNYLAYWGGKKASNFSYQKAANLVTIAKK